MDPKEFKNQIIMRADIAHADAEAAIATHSEFEFNMVIGRLSALFSLADHYNFLPEALPEYPDDYGRCLIGLIDRFYLGQKVK